MFINNDLVKSEKMGQNSFGMHSVVNYFKWNK